MCCGGKESQIQLIGMLDSPYVRRVAISLQLLGWPFSHRSLSVFSTFAQLQEINPLGKAAPGKSLMQTRAEELQHTLRVCYVRFPP